MIDRLLGMAVTAPLKAMLTGVELLLAKAQLWEETAARHVSLAPQLAPLSALATRWRKLELVAWQSLLDTTRERAAAVAHQVRRLQSLCGWAGQVCLAGQPAPCLSRTHMYSSPSPRPGSICTASC